jgi:hypothetical protein
MRKKSVNRIVFSKVIGFLIFLILLAITNYLKSYVNSEFYAAIVNFFINNIFLSFLIMFLTMFAEIFWSFSFPMNILAPIISAVSSIFILTYIYRMWLFTEDYISSGINLPIGSIYYIVFWMVIIVGYVTILVRRGVRDLKEMKEEDVKRKETNKRNNKEVDWNDVGEEFKLAFYNLGSSLKRAFEPKKKGKK